jgi:hypothetical protein
MIGKGYLENVAAGKFTPGKTNARRIAAELLEMREAQHWIPIKERLPGPTDGAGRDKTVIGLFRDTEDYFPAPWDFFVEKPHLFTHWWRPPQPPEPEPEKEGQDA